jgi:predicted AAA+ superfamily ATPase
MYTSINVSVPKLPLAGYEDAGRFKAYVLDCGLLGAMVDLSSRAIVEGNSIYAEYKGAFVENFIASLLAPQSDGALHYWTSEHIAEVDFIVECEGELLPLEVKSGMMRSIKGLRVYAEKYHPSRLYRASPRNFERRDDFVNIPLYAIELFPGLR